MILYLSLSVVELGEIICIGVGIGDDTFLLSDKDDKILLEDLRSIISRYRITHIVVDQHMTMLHLHVR
jgi:hypothetical protein